MKTHFYYLDSSALIKRYVKELGSEKVEEIFSTTPFCFTSVLTYAEIYATFYRLFRDSVISKETLESLAYEFEMDWKKWTLVELRQEIRSLIPTILKNVSLKGADSVHLATSLFLKEQGLSFVFLCSDKRLCNGARDFQLKVLDPAI